MKNPKCYSFLLFILILCFLTPLSFSQSIDLSGEWRFQLDPEDHGESEKWFEEKLVETLNLPGCLQAQGFGDEVTIDTSWTGDIIDQSWFTDPRYEKYRQTGNVKVPFWLQPDRHYKGAAWYQKTFTIPDSWKSKRVTLRLERPHWKTSVWIDNRWIGSQDSLSTPHVFDLGHFPDSGEHQITIRVDNRMIVEVGKNAHSVTDHTQSNWNGIVGDVELFATSQVWIENLQVFPDIEERSVSIKYEIGNQTTSALNGVIRFKVWDDSGSTAEINQNISLRTGGGLGDVNIPLGIDAPLWDEFQPELHHLSAQLETTSNSGRQVVRDKRELEFGLREIRTSGTQFLFNGRRTFLRGTLECSIFPLTGYPPTKVHEWRRIIQQAQAFGLNHMRFHSWCPPEAAFSAADQLGFYFQVECGAWAKIGDGEPIDQWIYAEGDRILREYGNHPSFIFLAYGNEPGGDHQKEWLRELNSYWKKKDSRHLYTSGAGWPLIEESDFYSTPQPRIQLWGAGNSSRINSRPPETVTDYRDFIQSQRKPVISHEIGQWCVYPNFEEMDKYKGYLKPRNFEIFKETLSENHMRDLTRKFVMASGKLQVLCYKEDIESALRTPGFGGFQLLDLHDFPGQGTALVGVLDPFWDEKPYVTAEEYNQFCGVTVPLIRMSKRIWAQEERFSADLEVSHFGPAPLEDAYLTWRLMSQNSGPSSNEVIKQGQVGPVRITIGNGVKLSEIEFELSDLDVPAQYRLEVGIEGTQYLNGWDLWVYPDSVKHQIPKGITLARSLDRSTVNTLEKGGKVLLMPGPSQIETPVEIGFSSIFWNTAWTRNQAPHTLGILCDPKHRALSEFPTEYHSNWQWWELTNIKHAAAMVLDHLPPDLRPIIQPIDTWFENRRLGLLFEASVNQGKILVCSMDLETDLDQRLVARQMLASLLRYMESGDFQPSIEIGVEDLTKVIRH